MGRARSASFYEKTQGEAISPFYPRGAKAPGPMSLLLTVVFAILEGVTEVLPISRSGHAAVARVWIGGIAGIGGTAAAPWAGVVNLAVVLAILVLVRRRLARALTEGVRVASRRSIVEASPATRDAGVMALGAGVSAIAGALTLPRVELWQDSPTATGIGIVLSGLALASTAMVPGGAAQVFGRPHAANPTLLGAAVVGVAHGMAIFPGASRVGAALTLLLWMGTRPARAVDLALAITAPGLLFDFLRVAVARPGTFDSPALLVGLGCAFLGALAGGTALRALAARGRLAWLAIWTIPLGLALVAYARAVG